MVEVYVRGRDAITRSSKDNRITCTREADDDYWVTLTTWAYFYQIEFPYYYTCIEFR